MSKCKHPCLVSDTAVVLLFAVNFVLLDKTRVALQLHKQGDFSSD